MADNPYGEFSDLVPSQDYGEFADLVPQTGYLKEGGKAIARGFVGAAAATIKGAAGEREVYRDDRIKLAQQQLSVFDRIDAGQEVSPADDFEQYSKVSPERKAALRRHYEDILANAPKPENPADTSLYKAGQSLQQAGADKFRAAQGWENSWTSYIGEALGSTGLFAPAAATGPAAPAAVMTTGYLASAGGQIDDAIQHGASKDQILEAIRRGGPAGLTEDLPLEVLFSKIPLPAWGRVANGLIKALAVAGSEAGQEGLQQAWQNIVAKYTYNPDQDPTEGVASAAGAGAIVGGLLGGPAGLLEGEATPAQKAADKGHPFVTRGGEFEQTQTPVPPSEREHLKGHELLTEDDLRSPIPNDIISEGRAAVKEAGGPATAEGIAQRAAESTAIARRAREATDVARQAADDAAFQQRLGLTPEQITPVNPTDQELQTSLAKPAEEFVRNAPVSPQAQPPASAEAAGGGVAPGEAAASPRAPVASSEAIQRYGEFADLVQQPGVGQNGPTAATELQQAPAGGGAAGEIATPIRAAAGGEQAGAGAPGGGPAAAGQEATRLNGETDKQFAKRVVDKRPAPAALPESYPDYFIMDGATVVPIGDLVSSKSDEENAQGGGNAAKRMEAAANGELSKRPPITVERMSNGKYRILDGNGTYTSVKGYGWKAMPVLVEGAPAKSAGRITPHPTTFVGEKATPIQRAVFRQHKYTTVEELYRDAQARQDELAAAGASIANRIDGVTFSNPGLKKQETTAAKVTRKGYTHAGNITDAIRIGFKVDQPRMADEIIRGLAKDFEVLDEGWVTTPDGYSDRKALVRFSDGRIGEVQFWEPHLFQAKHEGLPGVVGGRKGHDIYNEIRDLPASHRRSELSRQSQELYAHALSLADASWANSGSLSKPAPKYLNLSRQSASDIRPQVVKTSPQSASTQSVSPGLSSALASESLKTTGRSSQLQNFTGAPPSTNIIPIARERVNEPTPQKLLRERMAAKRAAPEMAPVEPGRPPMAKFRSPEQEPVKATPTGPHGRLLVSDLGRGLHEEHMTEEGKQLFPERDVKDFDRVLHAMAEPEMGLQMAEETNGVGWYTEDTGRAISTTAGVFPTLLTNDEHRDLFLTLAGIFGNGTSPVDGWMAAGEAFNLFLKTGQIPVSREEASRAAGLPVEMTSFKKDGVQVTKAKGWTLRNAANEQQLALLRKLVEQRGSISRAMNFLLHKQSRADINAAMAAAGYETPRFNQKEVRAGPDEYGSLIFGPKLGRYILGLHGLELTSEDTTVDKWIVRAYRRWTGRLFETPIGDQGIAERPATDLERRTIFRIIDALAKKFKITPQDVQAVQWYYEQRLYDANGIPSEARTNTDGANKLVLHFGARGHGPRVASGRTNQARNVHTAEAGAAASLRPKAEGFVTASPAEFIAARNASVRPGYLSPLEPGDIANHTLLLSADRTYGAAVSPEGDIQNVFNNGGTKGSGARAMVAAIENGGRTLDCYDGFLPKFYRQFGFAETGRMTFNPDFAPEGWNFQRDDNPDVVFMGWKGYPSNAAASISTATSRENWIANDETTNRVTDWDVAKQQSRSEAQSAGAGAARLHGQARQVSRLGGPARGANLGTGEAAGRAVAKLRATTHAETERSIREIGQRLMERMDEMGAHNLGLKLHEALAIQTPNGPVDVSGLYFKNVIHVALDQTNRGALRTVTHETIHGLRDGGAFTQTEWSILSKKSAEDWVNDPTLAGEGDMSVVQLYGGVPRWMMLEEGVAHAYEAWKDGRDFGSTVNRIFQKVRDLLAAIRVAITGVKGWEDIFRDIESGKIGARERAGESRTTAFFQLKAGEDERPTAVQQRDNSSPLFRLRRPPQNQQQHQAVMQGYLNRGQFIDRAIRTPFQLFGGLDRHGVWNPTKNVNAAIRNKLNRGVIPTSGPMGWLGVFAENARRGLVDRVGLPEAYKALQRQAQINEAGIMREGQGHLKVLQQAGVGIQEAKVLHKMLTGQMVAAGDMGALALPIRQAIDDLGAEAVHWGLIPQESYDRNRGAYLHRVYLKHEEDRPHLGRMISQIMATQRQKFMASELKGRGLFWDMPPHRFPTGTVVGDKFHVVDQLNPATGKTQRRQLLPETQTPPTGQGYRYRGLYEVRRIKNGKVNLWRDYTPGERQRMGEILDARYAVGKTYMLLAHDLATGVFYHGVASNPELTSATEPREPWKNAGGAFDQHWNDPAIKWVKVPDVTIPKTATKRYGALAGKWVRTEIWKDMREQEIASTPNFWRAMMKFFKVNKTALSPVAHMNNIISNFTFMDMADVRMQDLARGIKSYFTRDRHYQEALDAGAFGHDLLSYEMREEVLRPMLKEIARDMQGGATNPVLARFGLLGRLADALFGVAAAGRDKMIAAYRAEDEVFRMALYLRRRDQGESAETAANHALDTFLNYDIRAPWVRFARNSGLPFISYTYRAIPKIAQMASERPWKLAKYATLMMAANALAYMWLGEDDDDERRERAALRDEEQGYTWMMTPRMLRMPFRDKDGLPVFLDTRRWIPAGDVFDLDQGSSAIAIPAPIQLGGPLAMAFEFLLNKKMFDGKEITNDLTDTFSEKVWKVADWQWKSWMPSALWVPNSWYWDKVANALYGATDTAGHPYSVPQAVASSFGIKVKPVDVEDGIKWHMVDFRNVSRELEDQLRSLSYQHKRGLISDAAFKDGAAAIEQKFLTLKQNIRDFKERTRKPAGG